MIWNRKRKKQAELDAKEALAAKIQADIDLSAAYQTKREVGEQTKRLRQINSENHFSEGLHRSFRGRTA